MTSHVDVPVIISGFDHVVLTVADIDETVAFYEGVLGMRAVPTGPGRMAVAFGDKTIGLHSAGLSHSASLDRGAGPGGAMPLPRHPVPGSAEICLVTSTSLEMVTAHLAASGVRIEAGPVRADGAGGPVTSVYIRDPDGNLIEIASYDSL
jgi:catechol 2,3-dioxygenase-like lactoylglutathione lyase family enzyme